MVSNLRKIVSAIAEQNEIKIEGFKMDKISAIERHLNADGDVEVAMSELDKVLGFHWDKYYPEIREQL
ncbi:MAG: hypothetical protein COX30_02920 [Candidatus Moranbacteria bacterium CG23_combo_of_CG06-09_8_20_14_all_39_10]|nr:MAG: hypothetical protein COX30_02920 [Candidatus Moranbacteria bacterium CG23_combo_of_CG06-09_8_20_14_all_39_10]